MSTASVTATQPGATVGWATANAATLRNAINNVLEASRRGSAYKLSPDEYQVLWMVANAGNDGTTNSVATFTQVVTTYS